jgi:hypothetical protein
LPASITQKIAVPISALCLNLSNFFSFPEKRVVFREKSAQKNRNTKTLQKKIPGSLRRPGFFLAK